MTTQEKLEKEITTTKWFIEDKEDMLDYYIQKVRKLLEKENDTIGSSIMQYAEDVSSTYAELKTMRMFLKHLKMLECQDE